MAEHIHEIFKFINPPDNVALQQCIDAIDACFYPWERCIPELNVESEGKVAVVWDSDMPQNVTGTYSGSKDGVKNVISLKPSGYTSYAFVLLHEIGHMVDDCALRDEQRAALVKKWHTDLDGRWDGYIQNGEEIVWSHNTPHVHRTSYPDGGWRATMADGVTYDGYYHRPNEAFADAFVAAFAPSVFGYPRFAHWSNDYAGVREIILSAPTPVPPPKTYLFPNDSIYRLYRATFLREPDKGGYDYWKAKLAGGLSLHKIADGFTGSTEFRQRYGSLDNKAFITLLYRNVMNREPDKAGMDHWMLHMYVGASRGFVLVGFSESTELINKINNERK